MWTPTQTQVRWHRRSRGKDTLDVEEIEMLVLSAFKK